jgi:hypothetical protein
MNRRMFIGSLAGRLLATCLAEGQQTGTPPLIGLLPLGSPADAYDQALVEAFRNLKTARAVGVVVPQSLRLRADLLIE